MLKRILISLFMGSLLPLSLFASSISKDECLKKSGDFIFAGNECIEYFTSEGDTENSINIVVHGTWDAGTNTLGRYAPFAETLSMATDITTIAVALPGYSNSSTNKLKSLSDKDSKHLAATKEYVVFLGSLVKALKEKYESTTVNLIAHSAGAMMSGTLSGLEPNLLNNVILAGGRYDIHKIEKDKGFISMIDVLNKIDKKTNFLFIYGTKDKISKPELTKSFYKVALKNGLNVKLIEVKDAVHIDLDMTDTSVEAITSMLESTL